MFHARVLEYTLTVGPGCLEHSLGNRYSQVGALKYTENVFFYFWESPRAVTPLGGESKSNLGCATLRLKRRDPQTAVIYNTSGHLPALARNEAGTVCWFLLAAGL